MPVADANSVIGQTLGDRYLVTDKLGEGGMGSVYKANDVKLGAEVVIKIPHPAMMKDADFASRFRHEIRSLVKLSHAHIVTVMDVGVYNGVPFAVMQYLSGGSLEDWQCPCEPASILEWLGDIADALDFMHARGLIHRDIKPANIFIDESGRACLGDFGIAKVLAAGEDSEEKGLTGTGMAIGTAEYMAPEMLMPDLYNEDYDGRADQYALAVAVYEMLADRPPFQGNTMATVAVKLAQTNPPPLYELQPSVSPALAQTVDRALSKNPVDRYSNCREFAEAVSAAIRGESTRHTSVAQVPPQAGRRTQAAATPRLPTMKETAPSAPMRTVQEQLGTAVPRTIQESQPGGLRSTLQESLPGGHRSTLPEGRPVGISEIFFEPGNDSMSFAKPKSGKFIEWLKSPVGMSSVAGGIICLSVAGFALSQMGQPEEVPKNETGKVVDKSPAEDIKRSTTDKATGQQPKTTTDDGGGSTKKPLQTPSTTGNSSGFSDLVKSLEPAIVRINVDLAVGSRTGNGFVVDDSGLIVTNNHIVQGARKVRVTFSDGTPKEIVGFRLQSPDMDLAILQIARPIGNLTVVPLANVFPKKGEFAATLGMVRGASLTPSEGIVEAIRSDSELEDFGLTKEGSWIQTTARISKKTSGGPLVSRKGLVIGLNTWIDKTEQNRSFAISSVDILEAIAAAKNGQLVSLPRSRGPMPTTSSKPKRFAGPFKTTPEAFGPTQAEKFEELWFGAAGVDLSKRKIAGVRTRSGLFLTIVAYGSPAYNAGLRQNDIIKNLNGEFISTIDDITKVGNAAKSGQTLKVDVLKFLKKGRHKAKTDSTSVTVRNVIPQYAINYVTKLDCPDPVKEYLFLQLLNYGKLLTTASESATKLGGLDRQRVVDGILKSGPFVPTLGPSLSDHSIPQLGSIWHANSIRILEIVRGGYVRFQLPFNYQRGMNFQRGPNFQQGANFQRGGRPMLMSVDTARLTKNSQVKFGVVQFFETKTYTTVDGVRTLALVAKRYSIERYLPSAADLKKMMSR